MEEKVLNVHDVAKKNDCSPQKAYNIINNIKKVYCKKHNIDEKYIPKIFVAGKISEKIYNEILN